MEDVMKVLDDDTLYLEAGEKFPFVCPACNTYIQPDEALEVVTCPKCQKLGTVAEFSKVVFFSIAKEVK